VTDLKWNRFTRRAVLAGMAATAAAPLARVAVARAAAPAVVIIGAGVAGLSASMKLSALGVSHQVIEASSRVGGRAFTQTQTFGVPCDEGAHWLHNAERNPLVGFARRSGVPVYESDEEWALFADGEWLEGDDEEEIWDEVESAGRAIERALDRDADVAIGSVIDSDTSKLGRFLIGPYEHAGSVGSLSTVDWDRQEEGTDMFCSGGLGALVAKWGAGVPVSFDTQASRVDWSGAGVRVETNKGTITADAVIVTVSTKVLASGGIKFSSLPQRTERAIHDLPLGSYNHIVLEFDGDPFELAPDTMLAYEGSGGTAGLLINAGGAGLTYLDVAGDFGASLTARGEDAMVEFARAAVGDMLGAEGLADLTKAKAFPWEANPLFGGAYTAAKPGRAGARQDLKRPLGDRVFFAGEATNLSKPATLDGAIAEGARAAALAADEVD